MTRARAYVRPTDRRIAHMREVLRWQFAFGMQPTRFDNDLRRWVVVELLEARRVMCCLCGHTYAPNQTHYIQEHFVRKHHVRHGVAFLRAIDAISASACYPIDRDAVEARVEPWMRGLRAEVRAHGK